MDNPHLKVLPDQQKVQHVLDRAQANHDEAAAAGASTEPQADTAVADQPAPDSGIARKLLEGKIIELMRTVYDPEIPVNIYELGLIYAIDIDDNNAVDIRMTLTAPGCPVAGSLVEEVQAKVQSLDEVTRADVQLVWDPPWDKEMMSEAARLDLGLM